jgi:hypothetical protein
LAEYPSVASQTCNDADLSSKAIGCGDVWDMEL